MKKNKRIILTITSKDKEKFDEMREDYDINISAFFRECLRNKYQDLKRKENDCL